MELSMKSRKELTKVTARRYRRSNRKGKTAILDEFVASTGYNRAYAALLLRNYAGVKRISTGAGADVRLSPSKRRRRAGGRPKKYDKAVVVALEKLWKHFGHLCGKRLVVVIRMSLPYLTEHREFSISTESAQALAGISAATVDRLLGPARKRLFLKGIRHTKAVSTLAASIPVRTFSEWDHLAAGHLQLDLVAHDGGVAGGEHCFTLCVTDVCSLWCERRALPSKAARWVSAALDDILHAIPFAVIEVHPDNGSEFINRNLVDYCAANGIAMSRSRSGEKNDNCYVEQKNFDAVRKLIGYARYSGDLAAEKINELYRTHSVLQNYVYPSQKLLSKSRQGARVIKHHDTPCPPARRLLQRSDLEPRSHWKIHAVMQKLDPIALAATVTAQQRAALKLAVYQPTQPSSSQGASA